MFLTTKDLFNEVISRITLPEHTDYALADEAIDIYDTDFSVYGKVDYGGSEGIYLDFMIAGCFGPDNEHLVKDLGTIKTLNDSDEAYRDFCNLIADFVFGVREYRKKHQNELVRKGYLVRKNGSGATRYIYDVDKAHQLAKEGHEVFDCLNQCLLLECQWREAVLKAYKEYEPEESFIAAYKSNELYFVHGDLNIYCFDCNFKFLWNFSARDVFATKDGAEAFEMKEDCLLLRDFEGYTYFVGYDGKIIKEFAPGVHGCVI